MIQLNYVVMDMRPYWVVKCEWGIVPALYSSEQSARLASELFTNYPKLFWPIRFQAGTTFRESPTTQEREAFIHNEWVLFLPEYFKVFWGFKAPGHFPKPNIFPTQEDAFTYALERGEFNVIRVPKHRSRFLAR